MEPRNAEGPDRRQNATAAAGAVFQLMPSNGMLGGDVLVNDDNTNGANRTAT